MLLTILCTFRPGAFAEAKRLRLEHYEFLRREHANIVEGGPLLNGDGVPEAMLIVVERESIAAARDFINGEPYTAAGLFEEVSVRPWRHVVPEPAPGFIESEYARELAARKTG